MSGKPKSDSTKRVHHGYPTNRIQHDDIARRLHYTAMRMKSLHIGCNHGQGVVPGHADGDTLFDITE